jgi:hypothetical protein
MLGAAVSTESKSRYGATARQRLVSALATDPLIKDGWQLLGAGMVALGEQSEWIQRRYGSALLRKKAGNLKQP